MATQEYKCPACGGAMEFDIKEQKLKCLYCDTVMSLAEYHAVAEKAKDNKVSQKEADQAGFDQEKSVYICESCGGEIVADKQTGATSCPFCGNHVVFKEIFEEGRVPDYVIPFQMSKEDAKQAYRSFVKNKRLLPKVFSAENHIDEIKGVYIPFWLYDTEVSVDVNYEGTTHKFWSDSNYNYTDTSFYEIRRKGSMEFTHVPVDGSEKMPNDLTESIEPFLMKGLQPYDGGFLAGFLANRYDVDEQAAKERALERIQKGAEDVVRGTVSGYDSVRTLSSQIMPEQVAAKYALYPVWLLTTTWKDAHYLFAMNGQTGKLVGNLPVSRSAAIKYYARFAAAFSAIMLLVEWIVRF